MAVAGWSTAAAALMGLAGCLGGDGDTDEPAAPATPRGELFFYAPVWEARVSRVELPAGAVTTRRIRAGAGDLPFRVLLTHGRLVYWGPRAPYSVDPGFRTHPRRLGRGGYAYFVPSQRRGHVWLTEQDSSDEQRPSLSTVHEVPLDGRPAGAKQRLPPGRWTILLGSLGRFLLFDGESHGIAVWDPRARTVVDRLPTKNIAATHAESVAWWAGRGGRRELVISKLRGGSLEVERRVRGTRLPRGSAAFSPDGSRVAIARKTGLAIVTVGTGAARLVDNASVSADPEIAWSGDGAWLYLADRSTGEIWAYEPGADGATRLEARAPVYPPRYGGRLAFMDMAAR